MTGFIQLEPSQSDPVGAPGCQELHGLGQAGWPLYPWASPSSGESRPGRRVELPHTALQEPI